MRESGLITGTPALRLFLAQYTALIDMWVVSGYEGDESE